MNSWERERKGNSKKKNKLILQKEVNKKTAAM